MPQITVLISEPNAPGSSFLPYVWAVLKSYWERHADDPGAVHWLDPISRRDVIHHGLDAHYEIPPDVLGLSCYTWNWVVNCQVARWAKTRNPHCLVIAGGPDPDYKDPRFFEKHPYIDAIVVKDGEIPFTRILDSHSRGQRDLREIPGLYLPSDPSSLPILNDTSQPHFFTGEASVPSKFDHSPYADQFEILDRLVSGKGQSMMATLETTRGCPYACNYCDWGSATMSKVRRFDLERVEKDIDILAVLGVGLVFLADANFGILPRDLNIADYLADVRTRTGFPSYLHYCTAKNNPDRTVEISEKLFNSNLVREHWLAVQHTDDDVLRIADRSNISAGKYREVATKLTQSGIPCFVQLILGMPGDTVEKWKTCLGTLMEWGVHDHYQIAPYCLLPNAPAADPNFLHEWQVETIDRELIDAYGLRNRDARELTISKVVVAFKGYSRQDWAESMTYSALVRALHNMALTRLPSLYLRISYDVGFREFYGAVIDEFIAVESPWSSLYRQIRSVYDEILQNPAAVDDLPLDEFPKFPFYINPNKWAFVQLVKNHDRFSDDLARFLKARFPRAAHVTSVVKYQKSLVLTSDSFDSRSKRIRIDRDWPSYFAKVATSVESAKLPPPQSFRMPRLAVVSAQSVSREGSGEKGEPVSASRRREKWLEYVVGTPNTAGVCNLPHPRIEAAIKLPAFLKALAEV
jgi:putative methyltransferase